MEQSIDKKKERKKNEWWCPSSISLVKIENGDLNSRTCREIDLYDNGRKKNERKEMQSNKWQI